MMVACAGSCGGLVLQRKRKAELDQVKEGLRVWLERKAGEMKKRKKDSAGVKTLVWRFSKRAKSESSMAVVKCKMGVPEEVPAQGKVLGLRQYWEEVGTTNSSATVA